MNTKQSLTILGILIAIILCGVGIFIYFEIDNTREEENVPTLEKEKQVEYDLSNLFACRNTDTKKKCELDDNIVIDYNFEVESNRFFKILYNKKEIYKIPYMDFWNGKNDADIKITKYDKYIVISSNNSLSDCHYRFDVLAMDGKVLYSSEQKNYGLCNFEFDGKDTYTLNYRYNMLDGNEQNVCLRLDETNFSDKNLNFVNYKEGIVLDSELKTYYSEKTSYQDLCPKED